jgi:hypothetical protein
VSGLTEEEKEMLRSLPLHEQQPGAQPEKTEKHQKADEPVIKAAPPEKAVEPRKVKAARKTEETDDNTQARGTMVPVQYDDGDNGWSGTPVQMRG